MTISVKDNTTYGSLNFNGTEAVKFDATGITEGGNWGRRLAQVVTYQTGAVATGTTLIPLDDTIPQNTEGDQYMSLSITPTNASSTIEIEALCNVTTSAATNNFTLALFKDSDVGATYVVNMYCAATGGMIPIPLKAILSAGGTSAITFKIRCGGNIAGTTTFNGGAGARRFGGVINSYIIIKEYLP